MRIRGTYNPTKGFTMARQHLTEIQPAALPVAPARQADVSTMRPQLSPAKPLRFAVSLTNPEGMELFRKQFASSLEADSFAMASAELCPEYKVSSVDRIGGLAYELAGHTLTITASPKSHRGNGTDAITERPV